MDNHYLLNEDILWDYLDGLLSETEKSRVEALMEENAEARRRLAEIREERRMLFSLPPEKPSAGFADRVTAAWLMEQKAVRVPGKSTKSDPVIRVIASVFALFILLPVGLMIFQSPKGGSSMFNPDALLTSIPKVDVTGFAVGPFIQYSLLLLIAFLSLSLTERFWRLHTAKITGY